MDQHNPPESPFGNRKVKQMFMTVRNSGTDQGQSSAGSQMFMINFITTDRIDPYEHQVRAYFEESELEALSHSIKQHGILQPILVVKEGDRYKVVAGERRLRAAKHAGLDRVPARILNTSANATHEIALRENLDRVDLHPIEEGEGYLSLLESKAYSTHETIAKAFGKSKSRITECIGFTRLPAQTKVSLLQNGLKSRALLRRLMNTPAEEQNQLIDQNLKSLLKSQENSNILSTQVLEVAHKPKVIQPFEYKMTKRGLKVPSFKWKSGEGPEKLEAYRNTLRVLLEQIDLKLNK